MKIWEHRIIRANGVFSKTCLDTGHRDRFTMPDDNGSHQALTAHLTAPAGTGRDVTEAAPCRWTNGQARLPLEAVPVKPGSLLRLEILSAGPYRLDSTPA